MGDQGRGYRTPWQLNFVFSDFIDKIKTKGGIDVLDSLWETTQTKVKTNPRFANIAMKNFPQAWRSHLANVESFNQETEQGRARLNKFMTESPRNVQKPVWTRWGTVRYFILLYYHIINETN